MTNKESIYAQLLAGALAGTLANPNNRLYDQRDVDKAVLSATTAAQKAFAHYKRVMYTANK